MYVCMYVRMYVCANVSFLSIYYIHMLKILCYLFLNSMLVSIYGSCEMFVAEYRNLLADRLLQSCTFDISREVTIWIYTYTYVQYRYPYEEIYVKECCEINVLCCTCSLEGKYVHVCAA